MTKKTNHSFKTFLEKHLNTAQQRAVKRQKGSILVVAGAGSGKTRVITARITHLMINKNVFPSSIVALTFTNKSALEMKERIASFLDSHNELPFIGTFHAYCVRLLKQNQERLATPFFSILDEDDKQKMIKSILQHNNLHKQIAPKTIAYHISHMKNHTLDPTKPPLVYLNNQLFKDIYHAYETEKQANKCLDFDDLLLETLRLFKKHRDFKAAFQEQIAHILVDEYQDTNVVQHELLKQMANHKKELVVNSICAVGDEDQSIYSWRGATVANMLNFKKDFPATTIIKIEQNYRSVQPILDIANNVIQQNTQRIPKTLWSAKKGRDRIHCLSYLSEYQEAHAITQCILVAQQQYERKDIAILYRTHYQSRAIEEALIKESIPYRIIGGVQFYERKEIKDLLAYLKIIANPFDRTSLFRIINVPARGLGAKFEKQLYTQWHNEPFLTFKQIIEQLIKNETYTKSKLEALKEFTNVFDQLESTNMPSAALDQILQKTDYLQFLKNNYEPEDAQSRIDNIKELMDAIKHFESQGLKTITDFLQEVTLMQDKTARHKENNDTVLLMTLHAAKGLEFDVIILPGLEEGLLPTNRALQHDDRIEEERRLFYVGITRAKERLLITHTKHRYSYGQMVDQLPSRFLDEITQSLLPQDDCSYWNQDQTHDFFAQWFNVSEKSTSFTPAQKPPPKKQKTVIKRSTKNTSLLKKNQPVRHKTYGIGMVEKVEKKDTGKWYVTVRFKNALKKILADHLQRI